MVFEKIKSILAEQLGADEDDMTMDTDIAKDLGRKLGLITRQVG